MKKMIGSTLCLIGLWLGLAVFFLLAEIWIFMAVPDSMMDSGWMRGAELSLNQIPAILAVWLMACKIDGRTMADIGVKKRRWWLWLPLGAVFACLFYTLYWALSLRQGYLAAPRTNAGWNGNLFFYLVGYFLVALGEEWMCRGYLQELVYRKMGRAASLLLPSALFMILHLGSYGQRYTAYISAFGLGVLLAVMTWVTGSIWMSVGFHWLYNWMEGAFFGVEGEHFSVYASAVNHAGQWDLLPAYLAFVCAVIGSGLFIWYGRKSASEQVREKEEDGR
ncbi:MAG: CPBP family intramembrane glutamic endopeptidase [Blautia sp.]|jgi:membrane protease YdiL (CAAX protease family)